MFACVGPGVCACTHRKDGGYNTVIPPNGETTSQAKGKAAGGGWAADYPTTGAVRRVAGIWLRGTGELAQS